MLTVTSSSMTSRIPALICSSALSFFGRPLGLPLWPGWNRLCWGGFPFPTAYGASSYRLDLSDLFLCDIRSLLELQAWATERDWAVCVGVSCETGGRHHAVRPQNRVSEPGVNPEEKDEAAGAAPSFARRL